MFFLQKTITKHGDLQRGTATKISSRTIPMVTYLTLLDEILQEKKKKKKVEMKMRYGDGIMCLMATYDNKILVTLIVGCTY